MEPIIRELRETDLKEADRIFRLSFGTFLGLSDPMTFAGDADYITTRFIMDPSLSLAASVNEKIVGSNFIADWGSVGFFGPLTIHPDMWNKGIAKYLLEKTIEIFDKLGTKHIGLFTFAHSPKHIHLYQKFGFWPRFLTAIMSNSVFNSKTEEMNKHDNVKVNWSKYSDLQENQKSEIIKECNRLTDSIYTDLNLTKEILAVHTQKLGETILLWDKKDNRLCGFAICHCGPKTEAGSNTCYIKFGVVNKSNSNSASQNFEYLLDCCEIFASLQGISKLVGGVNIGNLDAYRIMISRGFRTDFQGVLMMRNNDPGYHNENVYVINDWR